MDGKPFSISGSAKKMIINHGYPGMPITETISNGFFTVDQIWNVKYWNKAAEAILGVKAIDIVGKNLWEKFAETIPLEFYAVYQKAFLTDIPIHFEEYWGEMGSWFDVVTYYCDDTLSVSFKSSNHHSSFKEKPEERLKIMTEMYQLVTEVTNDCLWEWDLIAKEMFWIDGGHKRLFGYDVENALIPQSFWESRLHPDDRVGILRKLQKLINSKPGVVWEEEYRFQKSNGEYAWVHDRGHIIYDNNNAIRMIGATQDITGRKFTETRLLESERKLAHVVRQMDDAVIITDNRGKITWTNPSFSLITGYKPEEVTGKRIDSFLYGEETDQSTAEYISLKMRDKQPYECNIINYTKSGSKLWMHIQGQPIFDAHQNLLQYFSIETNITERILLEERLAKDRKLKQLEITDAVLTAQENERENIGKKLHDDLNQLLVTAKLFIELAKKDEEKREQYLDKSVNFIVTVIGEIRRISHNLIPHGMYHNVFDSIRIFIADLNNSLPIKIDFYKEGIDKIAIPEKIQLAIFRIVQEQIINIFKHAQAKNIHIKLSCQDNEIILEISDNGNGCDPNEKRKGVGIRNIMSRAELFHGSVAIVTEPGNGYHIKVVFPLVDIHPKVPKQINDRIQYKEDDNRIFVGTGLNNTHSQKGSYGLFLTDDFFLFNNRQAVLQTYNEYKGEAYLWHMDDANGCVSLIEAKLMSVYSPALEAW